MRRIGIVGFGLPGGAVAGRLLARGFAVAAYDNEDLTAVVTTLERQAGMAP